MSFWKQTQERLAFIASLDIPPSELVSVTMYERYTVCHVMGDRLLALARRLGVSEFEVTHWDADQLRFFASDIEFVAVCNAGVVAEARREFAVSVNELVAA